MGFNLVYCMASSSKVVFKGVSLHLTFDPSKSAVLNFPIISKGYLLDPQLIVVQVLFWGFIGIMRYILVFNGL